MAGMLMVAVALPLSNYLMSLGQFIMAGGWLLCARLNARISNAMRHPFFLLFAGLYLLHLTGLLITEDMAYAMKDLRIKLPLLLLPLLFFSAPELPVSFVRWAFLLLMGAVLASTLAGAAVAAGWTHRQVHDFRDLSLFISHIRLSLLIVLAVALAAWFFHQRREQLVRAGLVLYAAWMIGFLVLLQSITGLLIGGMLIMIGLSFVARKSGPLVKAVSIVLLLSGIYGSYSLYRYVFVDSLVLPERPISGLPVLTARGNVYHYDTTRIDIENGRYVWMQYNELEMDTAWRLRSSHSVWNKDAQGHMLLVTLARYLTYKDYGRDAGGIARLTDEEVKQIEHGYPTPEDARQGGGLPSRLRELATEYRTWYYDGWASGHSLAQRLEYWKTARGIWLQQPWTGVGTGDVQTAFDEAYRQNNSRLEDPFRKRAHNQYLTMAVTFGWFGLLYFIFLLLSLFRRAIRSGSPVFVAFVVIAAGSFLSEDTLETQAGVTFFAFLSCLFLLHPSALSGRDTEMR